MFSAIGEAGVALRPGDWITVPSGVYAGLDAQVVEVQPIAAHVDRARVRICVFGSAAVDHWQVCYTGPVSETDWLTETDTASMERFLLALPSPPSLRHWRLYACACVRRVWSSVPQGPARAAVETAEQYAEGEVNWAVLAAAARRVAGVQGRNWIQESAIRAAWATAAPGNESTLARRLALRVAGSTAEAETQRHLLREVFGNPFRPVFADPIWMSYNDGLVRRLARMIAREKCFEEMPILGDALEDAGCTDSGILEHCRCGEPHIRGCHLLAALLAEGGNP